MTSLIRKWGFTGTREGMTHDQKSRLDKYIWMAPEPNEVHHGMCVGADAEFNDMVANMRSTVPSCWIIIHGHPSTMSDYTMTLGREHINVVHDMLPPLDRNHVIVDSCELLIACPKETKEITRSGTWATIRYARTRPHCKIVIIYPDGIVVPETK